MVLFTITEFLDIVVMTLAVGFIFSSFFEKFRRHEYYDPIKERSKSLNLKPLLFSLYFTAPAIVLHELAHKFTALSFGLNAEFHAAYAWLGLGILLKLINFPFIFFVPGYVSIHGSTSPLNYAITAFAGPFLNMMLWLCPAYLAKRNIFAKHRNMLLLTSRINMFLFIFNMLPIPGFDGSGVLTGLVKWYS